jgi:hypothetical protein
MSYKDWQPSNANHDWARTLDDDGNEVPNMRKLQKPILTQWQTMGDAAISIHESFLLLSKVDELKYLTYEATYYY